MKKNCTNLFSMYTLIVLLSLIFQSIFANLNETYTSGSIKIEWTSNDQNKTNFTMSSSGMTSGNYFAFGLSYDTSMVILKKIL